MPQVRSSAAREGYVGADRAADYGRRNAVEGGVLVRVSLDHVLAEKDIAT